MASCALYAALAVALALQVVPTWAGPNSRKMLKESPAMLSGRAVILARDFQDQAPTRVLLVRTTAGQRVAVQLSDERQLAGIATGMKVEVTGQWQQVADGGQATSFMAASVRAAAAAPAAGAGTGQGVVAAAVAPGVKAAAAAATTTMTLSSNPVIVADLKAVVIPIQGLTGSGSACPNGALPKYSVEEVKRAVFEESNPAGPTVGGTFNQCSYGKAKLTAQNSAVTDMVSLPCNGTTADLPWSFSTCSYDDIDGITAAADEALLDRGFPLTSYKYRVYLLPPGACRFVGTGFVGCDGTPGFECRAWIGGSHWTQPNAIAHELGHSLFLGHAGAAAISGVGAFDEYADTTCAMGYCCSSRCFNTPHAWQLGWISMQHLDGASLAAGQTVVAHLASQSTSARSGLRIVPSWTVGQDPLFLGYRTAQGGDAQMGSNAGKVHVYTAPITGSYNTSWTTWKAGLAAGESWEHPTAGLVVRLRSISKGQAIVSVCRKGGAETAATCAARLDNDCNGLAGAADPGCARLLKKRARTAAAKKQKTV